MYPDNNNNNNNNNNNIIIIIKRKKINQRKGERASRRERVGEKKFYFLFFSFRFFLISTKIGPQVFIGTEGKVDLRNESYA